MAIHVGDYGRPIKALITLDGEDRDVSDATIDLILTKPSGETVAKTMTGAVGYAAYVIEQGVVDEAGKWTGHIAITEGGICDNYDFWTWVLR